MKGGEGWFSRQLDRISRILQTDIRYVIRGNIWLGSSHLLIIVMLLITNIIIGRFIPRFEYGQYQYLLSVAEVIGAFALSGFSTVVVQSVARGYDGILPVAVKKNLRWSFGVLGLGAAFALYYALRHTPVYAIAFLVIGITMPIYASASFSDYFLIGKKDFRASGLLNMLTSVGTGVSLIIAILLHAKLLYLVLTYFIARTVFEIIEYLLTITFYPPTHTRVEDGAVPYAVHLSAIGILNTFADQADALWVFHFLGPVSLAVWSFAVAGPELLKGFVKKIGSMVLPRFSTYTLTQIRRHLLRRMIILSLVMIPVVVAYIFAAPFLFEFILPQYIDAVKYSQIFSLSIFIAAPLVLVSPVLRTIAIKQQIYVFNISSEIFQTIALLIGTFYFGLIGTIFAYFCARAFRLLFGCFLIWTTPEEASLIAYKT